VTNAYGVLLDDASLRWAAAESVSETVIAAICLLETRSVDEIVARLTPAELEQVIKIVGRSPRGYAPGAYDALKGKRNLAQPQPPIRRSKSPPADVCPCPRDRRSDPARAIHVSAASASSRRRKYVRRCMPRGFSGKGSNGSGLPPSRIRIFCDLRRLPNADFSCWLA
jgi:hypothetical protein